jgi:type IV pilus assembly protein PilE
MDILITVAIIGILAAVAYPSFAGVLAKGARAEGRVAATRMLMEQERYFTQANTYVAIDPQVASGQVLRNFSGDARAASKYWVGARACGSAALNQCVEVYAVPQFGGGDPDVGVLTIRSTGAARGCTGSKPQLCWPS